MKIKFKLGELYDILDQYAMLLGDVEDEWVESDDGCLLRVSGYRVVISKLKTSFRTGELYFRNEEVEDPEADNAWDFAHSADISYKENEKDPKKYTAYSTVSIQLLLEEACTKYKYPFAEVNSLNCYIDTEEFIDEDTVRRMYPKDWKEAAKAKYPELFDVIKDKQYFMSKEYDGVEVQVYASDFIYINITLRPCYLWYQHCGHYTIIARNEDEYPEVYKRIVALTKDLVEGNTAVIYVFSSEDGRKKTDLLVPGDEARELATDEAVVKYVQEKGVDMTTQRDHVLFTIDIYLWDEGSKRFRIWT